MDLFNRWQKQLDDLRAAGRYRSLRLPAGVDFTSNDYLGYAGLPAADTGLPRSGTSSRLLRGHHAIWDQVEAALADWHGCEAALMFTSGYHANEGLLATIIEPGDFVASDQFNHASLIDGMRLAQAERFIFRHNDLAHLHGGLREASPKGQRFVVTESLFSMEGDHAPLADLVELCERHDAHLIVDEAHSTGCLGPAGAGCVTGLGLRERVLATVHTGGKALSALGAYVCGSRLLRELLVNRCRHVIFTTALPPAVGAWWLDSLERVRADDDARGRLRKNAEFFRSELARHGCRPLGSDYIVPVVVGSDEPAVAAAVRLQERGFDIRAIRPPTVPLGTARLRIAIHANHDRDVLRQAAEAVTLIFS